MRAFIVEWFHASERSELLKSLGPWKKIVSSIVPFSNANDTKKKKKKKGRKREGFTGAILNGDEGKLGSRLLQFLSKLCSRSGLTIRRNRENPSMNNQYWREARTKLFPPSLSNFKELDPHERPSSPRELVGRTEFARIFYFSLGSRAHGYSTCRKRAYHPVARVHSLWTEAGHYLLLHRDSSTFCFNYTSLGRASNSNDFSVFARRFANEKTLEFHANLVRFSTIWKYKLSN